MSRKNGHNGRSGRNAGNSNNSSSLTSTSSTSSTTSTSSSSVEDARTGNHNNKSSKSSTHHSKATSSSSGTGSSRNNRQNNSNNTTTASKVELICDILYSVILIVGVSFLCIRLYTYVLGPLNHHDNHHSNNSIMSFIRNGHRARRTTTVTSTNSLQNHHGTNSHHQHDPPTLPPTASFHSNSIHNGNFDNMNMNINNNIYMNINNQLQGIDAIHPGPTTTSTSTSRMFVHARNMDQQQPSFDNNFPSIQIIKGFPDLVAASYDASATTTGTSSSTTQPNIHTVYHPQQQQQQQVSYHTTRPNDYKTTTFPDFGVTTYSSPSLGTIISKNDMDNSIPANINNNNNNNNQHHHRYKYYYFDTFSQSFHLQQDFHYDFPALKFANSSSASNSYRITTPTASITTTDQEINSIVKDSSSIQILRSPYLSPKNQPSICPDGRSVGYSDWNTLRNAIHEIGNTYELAVSLWNQYHAAMDEYEMIQLLYSLHGNNYDATSTTTTTVTNTNADSTVTMNSSSNNNVEMIYPPPPLPPQLLQFFDTVPDPFIVCPKTTLRSYSYSSQPIYINAEDVTLSCHSCTVVISRGTHLSFGPYAKNVKVEGFTFKGATETSVVFHQDGADVVFEDCYWVDNTGTGMYGAVADVNSTSSVRFWKCDMSDLKPEMHSPRTISTTPGMPTGFVSSLTMRTKNENEPGAVKAMGVL